MEEEKNTQSQENESEEIRVGVYVCHCGGNISDVVDTKEVVEAVKKNPNVKIAKDFVFMCSDPGQKLIIDDIIENKINRIVVSACSPTLHETTFRKALSRAGLNPYLYEHVNIREQDSWVHKGENEAATAKAIRLTAAGVEKIARQDPLEPIVVNAEGHVVVIGGGVAGMRAALALFKRGLGVTLIEKGDRLGGRVLELDRVYPTEEKAVDIVSQLETAVRAEKIDIRLNSEIELIEGFVGNFDVQIRDKDSKIEKVRAGAIVLATGFDHYQPYEGEFGYGKSPTVVTLPEFNKLIAEMSPADKFTYKGKEIRNIAFIHCVGSRQVEGVHQPQADGHVNDYCSRVCCTATLHTINKTLDKFPNLNVFDLYKDIRTYGHGHEDYYENASKRGVTFFRYTDDSIPEYAPSPNGSGATLTMKDVLTWNEEVCIPADMIVLSTGMVPRDISNLVSMLKLPIGTDRFLQEVHPKLRPVELANNGIMIAGACQYPMDITETCATSGASAAKISILLSKKTIEMDPYVARVDEAKCDGCKLCLAECEYKGALFMAESYAHVNPALCVGCGACVAVCPPRAINIAGWTLDQFDGMIDAISMEELEPESVPA